MLKRLRTTVLILCFLVCGIAAQVATTTTFWAGTSAGLLKSVDGGVTWQPVTVATSNSLLQGVPQIRAIAVDPQQPSTIYFVGNSNGTGFFRSNDAGNTWTGITLIGVAVGAGTTWLAVDPVLTNVIYLGAASALHMSTDFGTTWKEVTVPTGVGGLSVDPNASGTVYVSNANKVYKSVDYGTTWTQLTTIITGAETPAVGNVIVDPSNSNTLYVGDEYPFVNGSCGTTPLNGKDCGLFKSTDGGRSWTNVAPPGIYTEVVFDPRNSNLYVGANVTGVGNGVLKSTDGGNTWNPVNNTVTRNLLFPDPGASNTLVAFNPFGAAATIYRSNDAGTTWTQLNLKAVPVGNGSTAFPSVFCMAVARPLGNVSAASFQSGPAAPESIVSALGFDLATTSLSAPSQPAPNSLGGTSITVVDATGISRPAPLFYVSPGQVNYEIPAGTASGPARITVTSADGVKSSATLGISPVAPGLFALNSTGLAAAYAFRISGTNQTYENVYQLDSTKSVVPLPVDLGPSGDQVYLLLYGTGLRFAANVSATISGIVAPVIFAGAQGQFAGEDQVNVGPIPRSLTGSGSVAVILTADGHVANSVSVTIK